MIPAWTIVVAILLVAGAAWLVLSRRTPTTPAAAITASSQDFQPTIVNTAPPPSPVPPGMVWIHGGEFSMGAHDPPDMNDDVGMKATVDSRPIHRVYVDGFWNAVGGAIVITIVTWIVGLLFGDASEA